MKFCGLAAFLVLAFSFSYVAEAKGRSRGGGRKSTSHTIHTSSHTITHHHTQTHPKDSNTLFHRNEGGGATRPDSQPHHVPSAPPLYPSPIGFRPELTHGPVQRPMESPHQIPPAQSPPNQLPPAIHIHNTYQAPTHPGIPNNVPPPAYGHIAQAPVPAPTIIVQGGSSPGLGQLVKEAAVHSVVQAGVNRLFNGPSHHNSAISSSQNQPAAVNPAVTSNTTIIYNNYYGPQDNGQAPTGSNLANVPLSPAAAPISPASNSTNQNVTATAGLAGANLTSTNITIIHNLSVPQNFGQGPTSPNLLSRSGVGNSFKSNSPDQNVIIALPIYLFTHLFIYFYV